MYTVPKKIRDRGSQLHRPKGGIARINTAASSVTLRYRDVDGTQIEKLTLIARRS